MVLCRWTRGVQWDIILIAGWLFLWCTHGISCATYIASFSGCSTTSDPEFSILRKRGHNVLQGRRHLLKCRMMCLQAVMWRGKTAHLSNHCPFNPVNRTFHGQLCPLRTSSVAGSTRFLEWCTSLMIELSCHVEEHGQGTMAPHSSISMKVDGKPFANNVPRLSKSESATVVPI